MSKTVGKKAAQFHAGQRVEGGEPDTEDYDTGVIMKINGDQVTVAWDNLQTTTQPSELLRPL